MARTYQTKQQETILQYLKENGHRHVTAAEIAAHLAAQRTPVGLTTVYRHLEKLVAAGKVQKFLTDGTACACFQYLPSDELAHAHFHLKCLQCGTLLHMQCSFIETLTAHIMEAHQFSMLPMKTTFYGTCAACQALSSPS